MHIAILAFVLVILFIVGNLYANLRNINIMDPLTQSMSAYLTVPRGGKIQSASYIGLAAAELLLLYLHRGLNPWLWNLPLILAAAGLVLVVVTAWVKDNMSGQNLTNMEIVHKICAGVAFGAALVAEFYYLWHTPMVWLPGLGVIGTVALALFVKKTAVWYAAVEEKNLAVWVTLALVAIAGVPL